MKTLNRIIGILLLAISSSAWAFMPSAGVWQFGSEVLGAPGRGLTIDVQNEIVVFNYYGYRDDGTSIFYVAAGPITNNTFTADLLSVADGTVMGSSNPHPAQLIPSPGQVTISFSSGTSGTITLPGEQPLNIYKYEFGYADGPDGLLGTWLFTTETSIFPISEEETLTTESGVSSTNGNGIVTTSSENFICEYQVSGTLEGMVVCGDFPLQQYSNAYYYKFAGDRGTGVGSWFIDASATTLGTPYEADTLRIATKTGAQTGLNDGTTSSLVIMSAMRKSATSTLPMADIVKMKAAATSTLAGAVISDKDAAKASALKSWANEVNAILHQVH